MSKHKKISIITPSFNQGQFIDQTIDSVLSQGYPRLEYIIIDGGSTDNTVDIIKRHEKHLKYWVSEPDNGQTQAINKGFRHVTGEIINWLNSDDYYLPDTFKRVNNHFQELNCDVLLGKSNIFHQAPEKGIISKGGHLFESIERTIGDSLLDQPSAFFRTQAFKNFSPLNESLKYLMDRDMWIKHLLMNGLKKISKTEDVYVNFRMHENSKTVSEFKGFNTERNALFHNLFQCAGVYKSETELTNFITVANTNSDWPADIQPTINMVNVYHEFCAVLCKEAYANNDFSLTKKLLNQISRQNIEPQTQSELKSIQTKLTFIPNKALEWLKNQKS